jgi:hypothetical protein
MVDRSLWVATEIIIRRSRRAVAMEIIIRRWRTDPVPADLSTEYKSVADARFRSVEPWLIPLRRDAERTSS